MEPKKISFGFNKLLKKANIISSNVKQDDKKIDLIDCLEGQSIKVKDAVEKIKEPLVIPIKDTQKNLFDRIRDSKKRDRPLNQLPNKIEDNRPDSELSVDELVARQLIREAEDRLAQRNTIKENKVSVLPVNQNALEGEKEPTLEDYESVPISDYGLALLRGMGWKEGMAVGRNTSKTVSVSVPELRPKGLGLGATKVVQSEMPTKKTVDKDGKELILVKGVHAKLIAGAKKGHYCEVQGFDEEAGRVIVKVYPKGDNLNVNELMLVPVSQEEFSKGSKILNNSKYEEYLEISDRKLEKFKIKQDPLKSENIKEEQNSDLDAEKWDKGKTESKKYNQDVKQFSLCSDGRDTRPENGYMKNKLRSELSNTEYETEKRPQSHTKLKYKDRSRSPSGSKNDKYRRHSDYASDSEYYEKEKKSIKHSKSKYRDRSEDERRFKTKYKEDKKHKSKNRQDSSTSESDSKRDKRKKNKCKSRHRRNSSSSSTHWKSYRSKK